MFGSATSNRLVCTRDKVQINSKIVVVKNDYMEFLMVFIAALTLSFLLCVAGLIYILLELVSIGCNPERH